MNGQPIKINSSVITQMELSKISKSDVLTVAAVVLSIAVLILCARFSASSPVSRSHTAFLIPPRHLKEFAFGYTEVFADSLWLRVIQDFDHCENNTGERKQGPINCASMDKGWVYHMLDGITELAPRFRAAYIHGGTILSIVLNDKEGARLIYERALKNYPQDWSLEYRAAYHYLYELNDPTKAADLLVQAGKDGAPRWVYSLAARLLSESGKDLLGKSMLESVIAANPDASFTPRLKQRLDEINQKLRASGDLQPGSNINAEPAP